MNSKFPLAITILLSVCMGLTPPIFSQIKLTIKRESVNSNCITGYLFVDEKPLLYTLELPYIDNINNVSSVPTGSYNAKIRLDGKLGWRIELRDVPGDRHNIEIHVGNYTSNSTGCTLLGKKINIDSCQVLDSKNAILLLSNELKKFKEDLCLECNSSSEYDIVVQYKNP